MQNWLVPLVIVVLLGSAFIFLTPAQYGRTDLSAFPDLKDVALANRTIVDFGTARGGVVAYSYLSGPVPEALAENEVPELRNENSYTTFIAVVEDSTDPVLKLETRFYSQPVYAQDVDGSWRYLEYATTTEQAFRDRDMTFWKALAELVVRTAYADTISPFSAVGDGYIEGDGSDVSDPCGSSWDLEVEGTIDYTGTTGIAKGQSRVGAVCNSSRHRYFVPFVTSAIPSGSTITEATLNVYVTAKTNAVNDGTDYVVPIQTSQATHTSLGTTDWLAVGVTQGSSIIDITSITTSAYLGFALDNGLAWIATSGQASNCSATSGVSCFGILEGHDTSGLQPASNINGNSVTFSTSEETGTTQDPYLAVTYTAPASALAVRGSLKVTSAGTLKITGGGIKIQ